MLSMDQWIDIASKFGVPVMMLAFLAYFVSRRIFPLFVRQLEDSNAQRKIEFEKFAEITEKARVLMSETQREHVAAMKELASEIRGYRDDVRKNR
jgi:hypothetical protein